QNNKFNAGIYGTEKFPNELLDELIIKDGKNYNRISFKNKFTWTQEYLEEQLKAGTNIFGSKDLVLSYKKQDYNREIPPNLIDEKVNVSTTEESGVNLTNIFNKEVFDFPKPANLIGYLINFK